MKDAATFESLFRQGLSAMDAGDADHLREILDAHPELATERLHSPGHVADQSNW